MIAILTNRSDDIIIRAMGEADGELVIPGGDLEVLEMLAQALVDELNSRCGDDTEYVLEEVDLS